MRLNQAEEALCILHDRINELKEQINNLFSPKQSEREWEKATTELIGYMKLNQLGILAEIGYPKKENAHFEGRICDKTGKSEFILFDIKPAAYGGMALLERKLGDLVQKWALKNGLPKVTVVPNYTGPVTRESVGDKLGDVTKYLQKCLNGMTSIPYKPISIKIGNSNIELTIQEDTGVRVYGGMAYAHELHHSIKKQINKHIEEKGSLAVEENTPYILIYVRPKNCGGSDIQRHNLFSVVSALYHELRSMHEKWFQLWLGVVLFDWTSDPKVVCREGIFFEDADWPSGSTHETVARSLDIPAPRTISAQ